MTAELVLFLCLYTFLIMGVFLAPETGVVYSLQNSLPSLSARIEHRVITGHGFWSKEGDKGLKWDAPL